MRKGGTYIYIPVALESGMVGSKSVQDSVRHFPTLSRSVSVLLEVAQPGRNTRGYFMLLCFPWREDGERG